MYVERKVHNQTRDGPKTSRGRRDMLSCGAYANIIMSGRHTGCGGRKRRRYSSGRVLVGSLFGAVAALVLGTGRSQAHEERSPIPPLDAAPTATSVFRSAQPRPQHGESKEGRIGSRHRVLQSPCVKGKTRPEFAQRRVIAEVSCFSHAAAIYPKTNQTRQHARQLWHGCTW